MKNKKLVIAIIAIITVMTAAAGCGGGDAGKSDPNGGSAGGQTSGQEIEVDTAELEKYLTKTLSFDDYMEEMTDEDIIFELYDIDPELVENAWLYMSTGATAEELAVFELKETSADGVQAVIDACNSRADSQKKAFENYVPEEVDRIAECGVGVQQLESGKVNVCSIGVKNEDIVGAVADFVQLQTE